jgi:hypothetical protein
MRTRDHRLYRSRFSLTVIHCVPPPFCTNCGFLCGLRAAAPPDELGPRLRCDFDAQWPKWYRNALKAETLEVGYTKRGANGKPLAPDSAEAEEVCAVVYFRSLIWFFFFFRCW